MVSQFQLEGRFVRFEFKDGRLPKRLLLQTASELYNLKISKHLRSGLARLIIPGVHLRVSGEIKWDKHKLKRKALSVRVINPNQTNNRSVQSGTIQICGNRNCWKRGGEQVWEALEQALRQNRMDDHITLEKTGCLGNCKRCPSLVCMPAGALYGHFDPGNAHRLLEKHFTEVDQRRGAKVQSAM